jgi:toxin ParE1/3/4
MPSVYRVIISNEAISDLESISAYIADRSPLNAPQFMEKLADAVDSLQVFPQRHPHAPSRGAERRGLRMLTVAPYLIYYRIEESRNAVRVLTVRHAARRPPRIT